MWWCHGNWSWGSWLAMTVTMLVFWGLIAWVVVAVVGGTVTHRVPAVDSEATLARRFAAGEIDEDEYQRRLDVLRTARDHVNPKAGSQR